MTWLHWIKYVMNEQGADSTFPLIFKITFICNNCQVNAVSPLMCQLLDNVWFNFVQVSKVT